MMGGFHPFMTLRETRNIIMLQQKKKNMKLRVRAPCTNTCSLHLRDWLCSPYGAPRLWYLGGDSCLWRHYSLQVSDGNKWTICHEQTDRTGTDKTESYGPRGKSSWRREGSMMPPLQFKESIASHRVELFSCWAITSKPHASIITLSNSSKKHKNESFSP